MSDDTGSAARKLLEELEGRVAELQDGEDPVALSAAQVELGVHWGKLGQHHRAVPLFRAAWETRTTALGARDASTITAGLDLAAALRLERRSRQAFEVARKLLDDTPPSHAERAHVVAVYNELRPPGFRPAGGRPTRRKKKRRKR